MTSERLKRRSTMTFYINRVTEGDQSYKDRLCQRLADRLLHVPLQSEDESENTTGQVVIKVHRISMSGIEAVPVFTNKQLLEAWSRDVNSQADDMSILGADLCKVLDPKLWLIIDLGSEGELLLEPAAIKRIEEYGDQALLAEFGNNSNTEIIELEHEISAPISADQIIKDTGLENRAETEKKEPAENQSEINQGLRDWLNLNT